MRLSQKAVHERSITNDLQQEAPQEERSNKSSCQRLQWLLAEQYHWAAQSRNTRLFSYKYSS